MIRTIFVTLILFLTQTVSDYSAYASILDDDASKKKITLVRDNGKQPGGRPNAPDRQFVTCSYEDEILTITFAVSEGLSIVYIQPDNGNSIEYTFDTSDLVTSVWVGNCSEIFIEIITENDDIYSGILFLY